jgi:hypothetical protein
MDGGIDAMRGEREAAGESAFFEAEVQATGDLEWGVSAPLTPTFALKPSEVLGNEGGAYSSTDTYQSFNLHTDRLEREVEGRPGTLSERLEPDIMEPARWYSTISMGKLLLICLPIVCYPPLILRFWDRKRVEKGKPPNRKWVRALLWVHWAVYFALAVFALVFIGFIW